MVDTIAPSLSKRTERSSLSLIPIGLREASCDSPTFRATAVHFSDQVITIEKWLNTYTKYVSKLISDLTRIEESFNNVILRSVPPHSITEAVVDHDYTLVALNRYGESSKDWFLQIISCTKKLESQIVEPVKAFINGELRVFKEARRNLDQSQKIFDQVLARYVGQSKTKAPSALREDAFQVYEARKAYLKASLDFCILVPHFRFTVDKLLIKISYDHWREIKRSSENTVANLTKIGIEMDRIRGWSKEIEPSEAVFRRELHFARQEISEIAVESSKPSREIEDYNVSTVAFLGSKTPFKSDKKSSVEEMRMAEKQGWLFLRITTGKPARTSWARRWFYVKAGIFGWLVQGTYSGAVEESGRIGVLLCNVKPAVQEDRRFCFEIKTKNQAVLLQAETQQNLMEWLEVFERAKKTSLSGNPDTSSLPDSIEFEISAPLTFSSITKSTDGYFAHTNDELTGNLTDRLNNSFISGPDTSNLSGGVNIDTNTKNLLAPTTLAPAPASTSLSRKAISTNSERRTQLTSDFDSGLPSVIVANFWGSSNWGYIDRLERGHHLPYSNRINDQDKLHSKEDENCKPQTKIEGISETPPDFINSSNVTREVIGQVSSFKGNQVVSKSKIHTSTANFPSNYPLELIAQDAQFRILFPGVPKVDVLLLVFRAIWNHKEQQEFPGRVYVTQCHLYFYSHHLGLVLITGVNMKNISDVTAAPGKDCDFIFLHICEDLKEKTSRIALKIFLEPFRLLQSRLSYLIQISQAEISHEVEDILSTLIKMEHEKNLKTRTSWDSGEDIPIYTRVDTGIEQNQKNQVFRNSIHEERRPSSRMIKTETPKHHLPLYPVNYEPLDIQLKVVGREFNISSKALFHIICGDSSHVFQAFYHQRGATNIIQGAWLPLDQGRMKRDLTFQISRSNLLHTQQIIITDDQVIDLKEDHLRYLISYNNTLWHLPYYSDFKLVFKIVITFMAKSKCKLAIYAKVNWSEKPLFYKWLVEQQALFDSAFLAELLTEEITNQVKKLGPLNRTKKSQLIFGQVGQKSSAIKASFNNFESKNVINIKNQTILTLFLRIFLSHFQAVINFVLTCLLLTIKLIGSFTSTYGNILLILLLSLSLNVFFTLRDTSHWWAERKAVNFMTRLGVGPNQIVSRAIYIKDLDEALNLDPVQIPGLSDRKCYNQFRWITNATDLNLPHHLAGTVFIDVTTQSVARRLLRIRQNLGSYRHSILVASRLINNIEKEIIRAEWENWLLDENIRCERVSSLLYKELVNLSIVKNSDFSPKKFNINNKKLHNSEKIDALRKWKEAYCESCAIEQELLTRGKSHIIFD